MTVVGRIEVRARPGSKGDGIEWDQWRKRWAVSCREPATAGRANEAILRFLADRLRVPQTSIRFVTGSRSRAKVVEVDGLSDPEIAERLQRSLSAGA